MSYINLIDKLTELDKKRITNYISIYGVNKQSFIGVEEWLQNWSHANQKLFKLLGGELIKEFDYAFVKDEAEIEYLIRQDLLSMPFRQDYSNFFWDYVKKSETMTTEQVRFFNKLTDVDVFTNDSIKFGIKYKKPDSNKTLQIQAGMKPMRAFQKVMQYFDEYPWSKDNFEKFRLKHSMIFNDKKVMGKLCVSIHPLDYITMSDNSLNWSSCMSWKDNGCYHAGTVEMMNSNNTLCCYLKDKTDYLFGLRYFRRITDGTVEPEEKDIKKEDYTWNNKRWRQLVYITKDIIMTGKSYPYYNETISKDLLVKVRELAEKNLSWSYTYGPERYYDMIHIDSNGKFVKNRDWVRYGNAIKHNIIWDTNGMYNDMFNDNHYNYWCVRNKVKSNKIISVSGKCNCLVCNAPVLDESYSGYYNERFLGTDFVICSECRHNLQCDVCGCDCSFYNFYNISAYGVKRRICENCFKRNVKICPDCGKPMWTDVYNEWRNPHIVFIVNDWSRRFEYHSGENQMEEDPAVERAYMCANCQEKLEKAGYLYHGEMKKMNRFFERGELTRPVIGLHNLTKDEMERYRYINLKSVSFPKDNEEINLLPTAALIKTL